jgi:hypothetical protein
MSTPGGRGHAGAGAGGEVMRLLGSSAAKRPASGPHTIRSAVAAASRKPSRSGSSPRSAKKAGKNGEENPNALNRLATLIANILNPPAGNVLPMRRLSRHTGGVLRYGVEGRPGHQQFRQSGSGHVHAELFREGQKTLRPSPDPGLIWDLFGDLANEMRSAVVGVVFRSDLVIAFLMLMRASSPIASSRRSMYSWSAILCISFEQTVRLIAYASASFFQCYCLPCPPCF